MSTTPASHASARAQDRMCFGLAAVLIGLAGQLPGELHAQRAHPASDRAAVAIVERNLRATGTTAASAPTHMVTETRASLPAVAGAAPAVPAIRTETHLAPPDRAHVRATLGDQLLMEFGYDGTTGWSRSPTTGLVRLEGAELALVRASVTMGANVRLDSTVVVTSIGRQRLDGQLVDAIRTVNATGDTAEVLYLAESGLLAGIRRIKTAGASRDTALMTFGDYQRIGGRFEAMTLTMRSAGSGSVTRTIRLDHDPVDPKLFVPPPGLPAAPFVGVPRDTPTTPTIKE